MTSDKDESIAALLAALDLRKHGWITVDHWDADRCAIGVASSVEPRRLVYISTWKMEPGHCYWECEVPTGQDIADYSVTSQGYAQGLDTLLLVLRSHLS